MRQHLKWKYKIFNNFSSKLRPFSNLCSKHRKKLLCKSLRRLWVVKKYHMLYFQSLISKVLLQYFICELTKTVLISEVLKLETVGLIRLKDPSANNFIDDTKMNLK